MAALGQPAVNAMNQWLGDAKRPHKEREFAANTLTQIAKRHPDARDHVVAMHIQALRRHREQHHHVNATLASNLADMHVTEASPLVRDAYAAGTIDTAYAGTFAAWQEWAREDPAQREAQRAKLLKRYGSS